MSDGVSSVILLIGLAVGVDYSMFYLRREREERAKGRSPREALEVAAATSGRAVLISGITVMIAMAGMYFAGEHVHLVRHRHDPGRRRGDDRLADRPARAAGLAGRQGREGPDPVPVTRQVEQRRVASLGRDHRPRHAPAKLAAAVSAGLLVLMAVPVLGMHTELPGYETYSRSIPVMQSYDRIQEAFPGGARPLRRGRRGR